MRVAALYDIHGNLPALLAVLDEVAELEVDRIIVGGDILPGPLPRETLEALRGLDTPVASIRGNGENDVLAVLAGRTVDRVPEAVREILRWSARVLEPEDEAFLSGLPDTLRLGIPGLGETLFCHATPDSDADIFTRLTPEDRVLRLVGGTGADVVVCGHTHMPFDRRAGDIRIVNAGSVGMPFGDPGAWWALLGPDVELRHTPYDLRAAADRIRGSSYPLAGEFAERYVLHPPPEAAMLDLFERSLPADRVEGD